MPRDKDLKRLVRTRMEKTGEAYTTARAHLEKKKKPAIDYSALAGIADEKVTEKTGRTWAQWVKLLDSHEAHTLPHGEIAAIVSKTYGTASWWTQAVTVGYERIRGLRAQNQRRDGRFEANKSRTYPVAVKKMFDAWNNARTRNKWLKEKVKVRTATSPRSIRFDWPDGAILIVSFESKGREKTVVALTHTKLPDRAAVDRAKLEWAERLDALGAMFAKSQD